MAFFSLSVLLLLSFIFRASNLSFIARNQCRCTRLSQCTKISQCTKLLQCTKLCQLPGLCGLLFRSPVRLTTSQPSPDVRYISSLLFLSSLFKRAITLSLRRGFSRTAFHRRTLDAINVVKTNAAKYFNTIIMLTCQK